MRATFPTSARRGVRPSRASLDGTPRRDGTAMASTLPMGGENAPSVRYTTREEAAEAVRAARTECRTVPARIRRRGVATRRGDARDDGGLDRGGVGAITRAR